MTNLTRAAAEQMGQKRELALLYKIYVFHPLFCEKVSIAANLSNGSFDSRRLLQQGRNIGQTVWDALMPRVILTSYLQQGGLSRMT